MIYSAVDDRSGVAYQEYHGVYGEDVEAGLRFLFNAMAPKPEQDGAALQGIPTAIYSDNGAITKSAVFRRVMEHLERLLLLTFTRRAALEMTRRSQLTQLPHPIGNFGLV